jgi:hypothetical protein
VVDIPYGRLDLLQAHMATVFVYHLDVCGEPGSVYASLVEGL